VHYIIGGSRSNSCIVFSDLLWSVSHRYW